jgi:hypothetical protein
MIFYMDSANGTSYSGAAYIYSLLGSNCKEAVCEKTSDYAFNSAPNPFNPTTQISFSLPSKSPVNLTIYNIRGQAVKTLVSGLREAGTHTITWNAQGVNAGVYFYRLKAWEKVMVKKGVLVR